jgi:hypothetical protein
MALSEYVLLASLATGIHADGNPERIPSIGPEVITQPNGGAPVIVACITSKGACGDPGGGGGGGGPKKVTVQIAPQVVSPGSPSRLAHPPSIRAPIIRTPVVR